MARKSIKRTGCKTPLSHKKRSKRSYGGTAGRSKYITKYIGKITKIIFPNKEQSKKQQILYEQHWVMLSMLYNPKKERY